MNRRQRLGQHFLRSQSVASQIVAAADISEKDIVLEIGTGHGILTSKLCKSASRVISIESDSTLYTHALSRLYFENLTLICANGFTTDFDFTIFISNLPYSKSRTAIEWLATKKFSHAVIMVQKEFADKLLGQTKAVSVIANYCFDIQKVLRVGPNNFDPPPEIDSVVLRLTQRCTLNRDIIKAVNVLFSYRRKTVSSMLKKFGIHSIEQKRLDDISGDEIIKLGKKISMR